MGVSSRTSLVSLRQARFVSGSIFPSTLGCPPYFTAVGHMTQNDSPHIPYGNLARNDANAACVF